MANKSKDTRKDKQKKKPKLSIKEKRKAKKEKHVKWFNLNFDEAEQK